MGEIVKNSYLSQLRQHKHRPYEFVLCVCIIVLFVLLYYYLHG